jgi:hypothetical protein
MKFILKTLPFAIIALLMTVNVTGSYYSSKVTIKDNLFSTGEWEYEDPTHDIKPGDVIINEVMWAGSSKRSSDQWIELRNMTDRDINIGKWEIENSRAHGQPDLMIPANRIIPANGYFLLANYPKNSANTVVNVNVDVSNASIFLSSSENGHLILKDSKGKVIDRAKGDIWPAGVLGEGVWRSMQRLEGTKSKGLEEESWETCTHQDCNSGLYWKTAGGSNYGTPGNPNLYNNNGGGGVEVFGSSDDNLEQLDTNNDVEPLNREISELPVEILEE